MGCGASSDVAATAPMEAVVPKPRGSGSRTQQPQSEQLQGPPPPKPKPAVERTQTVVQPQETAPASSPSLAKRNSSATTGGPAPSPSLVNRKSSVNTGAAAATAGDGSFSCDVDASHVAVLWCGDCEERYCVPCDEHFHSRKKTRGHVRTPLQKPTSSSVEAAAAAPAVAAQQNVASSPATAATAAAPVPPLPAPIGRLPAPLPAMPTGPPAPLRAPAQLAPLRGHGGHPHPPTLPAALAPATAAPATPAAPPRSQHSSSPPPDAQPHPHTTKAKSVNPIIAQQRGMMRQRTVAGTSSSAAAAAATATAPSPSATGGKPAPSPPSTHKQRGVVGDGSSKQHLSTPLQRSSTVASPSAGALDTPQRQTTFLKNSPAKRGGGGGTPSIVGAPIQTVPVDKLRTLAGAQLETIWAHYDRDGNGVLDRKELAQLASDCIERTLSMLADEVKRANPGISESDLRAVVEREKQFILPGAGSSNKEEQHHQMVRMLVRKLDVNGDGSVTRTELMMQWNSFSAQLFQVREQEALGCSIM